MTFTIVGHSFKYELEKVARLFFPFEKFVFVTDPAAKDGVYTELDEEETALRLVASVTLGNQKEERETRLDKQTPLLEDSAELALATLLFECYVALTGYRPAWGIVTGIRPVRLLEHYRNRFDPETARRMLQKEFLVADEKMDLTEQCLASENAVIASSRPMDYSLYLSIPFCPSRCSYCSFVSHSVEQAKRLIPDYLNYLKKELAFTATIAEHCGLTLRTVYIGGGTPTVLSAEQLDDLMTAVETCFPIASAEEYTVEAGRPDTVTREKLEVIKRHGATRISINPQTMDNAVLAAVGRRHTAEQTVEAYRLAREVGFDNINMDLIAGLTGDTPETFRRTVDQLIKLDPENITVHTLSMKRASNMTKANMLYDIEAGEAVGEMLAYAKSALHAAGIEPYYMYRQNKTVGNLENVGYAKKGFEGLYNIFIMDETHTILACGASAVTKLREPGGDRIERIFNFKYPYEYINRFEELMARKAAILDFYGKNKSER